MVDGVEVASNNTEAGPLLGLEEVEEVRSTGLVRKVVGLDKPE
jgi:hypothetical protein